MAYRVEGSVAGPNIAGASARACTGFQSEGISSGSPDSEDCMICGSTQGLKLPEVSLPWFGLHHQKKTYRLFR